MTTFLQAAEAVAVSEETRMGLWTLFTKGGWLMWPLLALGGVTIFIFVERFMAIRKASVLDMNFMNRIRDYISDGKISTAVNLCKKTDTPIARMIEKGIERIGRPMSDVQTAIENVANLEVSKLENGLPFLATIAGGAPMIGFLGTVLGMVQTFMDMSAAGGTVDLGLLSSGMYVAMVTTVMGLIVGIPAYFGYNYLVARIEKLVFQMEANSIAFMDIPAAAVPLDRHDADQPQRPETDASEEFEPVEGQGDDHGVGSGCGPRQVSLLCRIAGRGFDRRRGAGAQGAARRAEGRYRLAPLRQDRCGGRGGEGYEHRQGQ